MIIEAFIKDTDYNHNRHLHLALNYLPNYSTSDSVTTV